MTNLVLLNQERGKKISEGQQRLVEGLEDLLKKAKDGELKGLCYASIEVENDAIVLGVLHADTCGLHELIGVSQMLNDRLLQTCRD